MNEYSSVIVTGTIAYDEIMNFPSRFADHIHPEKIHNLNVSFAVDRLEKQIGGTGLNISYNISHCLYLEKNKNKKVTLLAAVGKDGKEIINFCIKNKINTEKIYIDKKLYTASGKVITDISDNQIWGFYYGASEKSASLNLQEFINNQTLLIISANHPKAFSHFQKQAIRSKINYLYDPGMSLTWISDRDLSTGVLNCKWLVGNDYEIAVILKRINYSVKKLTDNGLRIITTLGEKGVRYEEKNQKIEVKSYKVKKIVDPTGAGDAWRGGFIAAVIAGKKLIDALKFANALASFAIESYGTVNHRPPLRSIEKRAKLLKIF